MTYPILNIIHLFGTEYSELRWNNISDQIRTQKILSYAFWPGIKDVPVYKGISRSHKQIVRWAKKLGIKEIVIMEDDARFLGIGAYDFFIKNKPKSYDIYLGTASNVLRKEGNVVRDFRGLLIYMIHEKFYDAFLGLTENQHLDCELKDKGDYYLCPQVIAEEMPGYSYNRKKILSRTYLIDQFAKYNAEKDPI